MDKFPFYKIQLNLPANLFAELAHSVDFEQFANDNKIANLLAISGNKVPILRTTSIYQKPAQQFAPIHQLIIENIQKQVAQVIDLEQDMVFNHATAEIYNQNYFKMKYHSDQALDLAANSYIALFSCYQQPEKLPLGLRRLKMQAKNGEEEQELDLEHNSVILFSTQTNQDYQHKIILPAENRPKAQKIDNQWLGITFRQSKTFIEFENGQPFFPNGQPLTMATEVQTAEFYRLKSAENQQLNYNYPDILYTISPSDMLPPRVKF